MISSSILSKLGIFIISDFLNPKECAKLRAEAAHAPSQRTTLYAKGSSSAFLQPEITNSKTHEISASSSKAIKNKIRALAPRIEDYFHTRLALKETPRFKTYPKGGFHAVHQDIVRGKNAPSFLKARKVAIIIFLSSEAPRAREGCHCGGSLVLYGLIAGEKSKRFGFPLAAKEGMLIAFPLTIIHEVLPVTAGTRCIILTFLSS